MKSILKVCAILLLLTFMACDQTKTVTFHQSHDPKRQNAPYSDAVEANGFLFLTGQIGTDPTTRKLAEGGIKAQTRQVIENIKTVLEHHNTSLDKVVKCTVILANINDFSAFNEVYTTYFPNKPARTTFAAASLAAGAMIEIEVIAVK